jgi:hypothetical protein
LTRKLSVQIRKVTIVRRIAATVAMASAVLFFRLLMLSGHAMDSNTDQLLG